MKKKEVLVIFKTHLDIGYTDLAENVVNNYINDFIPNAIRVGYELKDTETPFVWTVGSWLVWEALKQDKDGKIKQAIKDGVIRWHSLPYTSHTESMSPKLFEYGINISKKLDKMFGVETYAAKMTDVPGHTIGMVPYMEKAGIKFLHIGVNPVSAVPDVPEVFKWQYKGSSIIVMYQGDYGVPAEFDDFVLYFAHTSDNHGPQSPDEITKVYDDIKEKYPDAIIKCATLNDVADKLALIEDLPVVDKEIGDTWIHGIGTDPGKLSRYRRVLRYIDENGFGDVDIVDNLLLIPEHTWGVSIQVRFPFEHSFNHSELELLKDTDEYKFTESSWAEQRRYIEKAEALYGLEPEVVCEPDLCGYTEFDAGEPEFEISWELFDNKDYERFVKQYLREMAEKDKCWATWDNTKKGLPDYEGGIFVAKVTASYKKEDNVIYRLEFDSETKEKYGLPYFYVEKNDNKCYTVKWFDKKASRLPQAYWLKFKGLDEKWEVNKLGEWINPDEVIGSPLIMATYDGVKNKDVTIKTLDAALVAPFGRRLLQYGVEEKKQDLYFNLYNNQWNTNFPMWYSDDGLFRFEIEKNKQ